VFVTAYHSTADSLQAHGAGSKVHEILHLVVSRNAGSVVIISEKIIYHMNTVGRDVLKNVQISLFQKNFHICNEYRN
jgi:hypothetical protein